MSQRIRNLFIVGVVLILFLPAILTLKGGWPDFSDTGQIGDTIGGIMGPFVSILGAWLVYLSFQQQIEANRIQREALEEEKKGSRQASNFDTLRSLISELKTDYNQLRFHLVEGKEAINKFNEGNYTKDRHNFDGVFVLEYRYIVESVLYIHRCIQTFGLTVEQQAFLNYSLAFFVDNKLNNQAKTTLKKFHAVFSSEEEKEKYRLYVSSRKLREIDWQSLLE